MCIVYKNGGCFLNLILICTSKKYLLWFSGLIQPFCWGHFLLWTMWFVNHWRCVLIQTRHSSRLHASLNISDSKTYNYSAFLCFHFGKLRNIILKKIMFHVNVRITCDISFQNSWLNLFCAVIYFNQYEINSIIWWHKYFLYQFGW